MKRLDRYDGKRDPERTREPFGDGETGTAETTRGHFVIHLHDARRRHFDLRIQMGGALLSFAVPRGPTLDPEAKHLAVHTEDHPLEYLDFEDVIAAGEYGAGAMIAWDRGTIRYLETTAEAGLAIGKVDFVLSGFKVAGRFALVKLKKGNEEWLLLKKRDGYENGAVDVVASKPRSVYSGLTVEERAAAGNWTKERLGSIGKAEKPTKKRSNSLVWAPCHGGLHVEATKSDLSISLVADGQDYADRFPEVVTALRAHPASALVLAGELVVRDDGGHPRASLLDERLSKGDRSHLAAFVAHDLLEVSAIDLREAPLAKRREALESLVPDAGVVSAFPLFAVDGRAFAERARELGLFGVIGASAAATYQDTEWTFLRAAAPEGAPRFAIPPPPRSKRPRERVSVSNPDKIYFPELGIAKREVVAYYDAIAPTLLPFLARRPVALVRYPDGIHGKNFFQWHLPAGAPSWLRTLEVVEEDGKKRRLFLLDDADGLRYVANLGALPLHVLAFREGRQPLADFFTLDFDVKQSSLLEAIPIVLAVREMIEQAGLVGFLKTSGQTGLHVLVPLGDGATFEVARGLADLFGAALVQLFPDRATMERRVDKRGAKVFVDTGQTGPSRAIVAPYAIRANPSAGVSTPLAWGELDLGLDPRAFNLRTVPDRVARIGDPMANFSSTKANVAGALQALTAMFASRSRER